MFTLRRLTKVLIGSLFSFLFFTSSVFAADIWRNPAPYPEGMDTWYGTVYNTSAQHDYRLRIGGWGDTYNTLLRFDLSGLPQVADHMYIWLYPINEGAPTNINWNLIGQQWQSSTLTSQDFPLPSNVLYLLGQTAAPTQGQWYRIEIPVGIYNAWRSGAGAQYKNYGLFLAPASNNNNYSTFGSSQQGYYGPHLQVTYTPQANDNVITLKWPLGTNNSGRVVGGFHWQDNWVSSCGGLIKKHNGTDYSATAGWPVYAAEDGVVREFGPESTGQWASRIVLEHNHPSGGKYTTVYWHVNPIAMSIGNFIPKGMQIATVANLATGSHLHFGLRIGSYDSAYLNGTPFAGTGALPQNNCPDNPPNDKWYPAFPAGFISPEITSNVLFQ